jgi:Protein of unknown function (DUF2865)
MCRGSVASAAVRYVATLTLTVGATLWGGATLWDAVVVAPVFDAPSGKVAVLADGAPKIAAAMLESDDWMQSIRSEKFWASNKVGGSSAKAAKPDFSQRSGLIKASVPTPAPEAPAAKPQYSKSSQPKSERTDGSDWYEGDGGNHRTVCVRLCDGYFWPISFSTDSDNFDRDKRVCEKSCASPTRLFVHDNPGQDVEQMADLKGNPYTKLRTAFLFRTSYDESCKCNSHPWEQASKDRHRVYALEAEKRKGSQHAAAELTRMKSALIEARKAAMAVRTAAVETGSLSARALPVSAVKRFEAPVPVVIAGHSPMSATLTGSSGLVLAGPAAAVLDIMPITAAPVVAKQGRLQQWAQMTPPTSPLTSQVDGSQGAVPKTASSEPTIKLPNVPFALPSNPPIVSGLTGLIASLVQSKSPVPAPVVPAPVLPAAVLPAPVATPVETASLAKPNAPAAVASKLPVSAPPIVAGANDELGIKAPLAVNTAQLEQVNARRKPTGEQPKAADKSEPKPQRRAEPKVAAEEPAPRPKSRPVEPRPVERREPERPKPESRQEPRVVARPTPAPRVVERPAPRPVRVVEAPRPTPQVARVRPQQVTAVRSDNWRVRVFESR